jgi:preprotein translocase subunit YajC
MMKKFTYAALAAMMVMSVAACGKKEKAADTSALQETVSSETVAAAEQAKNSCTATIQKAYDSQIQVELDDGSSMNFNIKNAKVNQKYGLMPGDEVTLWYEADELSDGMELKAVEMNVPFELTSENYDQDPMGYGQITNIDDKSITIKEEEGRSEEDVPDGYPIDGKEYTFTRPSYGYVIGEPKKGDYAEVDFLGDLSSNAAAYRIVTQDAMENDENASDVRALIGTMGEVDEDGLFDLTTDEGTTFHFTTEGNAELIKKAKDAKGKKVTVSYSDSIRMRVTTCDNIAE